MPRATMLLAILAGAAAIAVAAPAETPTALRSVSVTLPKSARALPAGPGVDTVRENCTGCHSVGMILNQPAMPQAAWQAEVDKMRNVYKAPVDPNQVPAIVGYLTAVKGPK